jgi:hypothetical protein
MREKRRSIRKIHIHIALLLFELSCNNNILGMHRYVHPDILKEEQVTTLAALLKLYLRELPEPLFSYDLYDHVSNTKDTLLNSIIITFCLQQKIFENRVGYLIKMSLIKIILTFFFKLIEQKGRVQQSHLLDQMDPIHKRVLLVIMNLLRLIAANEQVIHYDVW